MNDKRRGLGRGLGALIPTGPTGSRPTDVFYGDSAVDEERFTGNIAPHERAGDTATETPTDAGDAAAELQPVPGATFAELPLDSIRPNRDQPRTVFDEDDLAELVHSIREIGILQPIVVRTLPGQEAEAGGPAYELVMGERRWRASREAGRTTIPAIVRDTADEFMLRDALLENLHRAQLNPLEEAAAYQQLLQDFGCTQEELAARIGRSRPQVSNTIRLMKLPPLVQRRVAAGVLSAGHARALLGLPDAAAMERVAQRIVAEGLSVRGTEEVVATGSDQAPSPRVSQPAPDDPELTELGNALGDRLDTRVTVSLGRKRGRLTIEFAGQDDLRRILSELGVTGATD
ncbi:chromosome segregation DNA-binding protein [Branchiibius hedensis]|uniref:Chromosome segregation DNA-binding protein n=1 Tax=Branchiibius hedensis TaxID=672460 RepID=A0A2Y8ZW78_9MICO|nr:ParB/RepB/Spo0J family partition protein [Branchiibius hedensis]PWJ26985.1 chromosome segregation DNA-binding protein [Branchiibius hedensis]SSA35796.1 chromosome segregation DNA-binding protein [Branchiibius hedensis]